ncbi:MAG: hypothetical protein ACFN2Z_06265 [Oribacterium sp.]
MESRYPVFTRGRILKGEMLEALRTYPEQYLRLSYENYTAGVLYGLELSSSEEGDGLRIGGGIVKYRGRIHILPEEKCLACPADGHRSYLYLSLEGEERDGDWECFSFSYRLQREEKREHGLLLGSFCLRPGFRLRDRYLDFRDCAAAFDTLDLRNADYAGPFRPAFHPKLLRLYALEGLRLQGLCEEEFLFCQLLLSRPEGFCRESLEHYIARRLRREYRELSNLELYEGLSELLKREGGRGTEEPGREGRKRIFLS